ncbi:hypothetical protein EDB83DRAFT_356824 [Lactarius deliciosus]|nr:hypothetical protein EDB83DRAFT_356824 [Lactarius deliciosus]
MCLYSRRFILCIPFWSEIRWVMSAMNLVGGVKPHPHFRFETETFTALPSLYLLIRSGERQPYSGPVPLSRE